MCGLSRPVSPPETNPTMETRGPSQFLVQLGDSVIQLEVQWDQSTTYPSHPRQRLVGTVIRANSICGPACLDSVPCRLACVEGQLEEISSLSTHSEEPDPPGT
ncbi:unnamed protein product [Echinostoma caproni]|uniref:DUF3694 domain-containing protein n=1 Tax=Echinostoma caproni TaxID=27848 RepID=A0A183A7R5_9TREM|nr:unnamed protein product [Echinostoma caproni]